MLLLKSRSWTKIINYLTCLTSKTLNIVQVYIVCGFFCAAHQTEAASCNNHSTNKNGPCHRGEPTNPENFQPRAKFVPHLNSS